MKHTFDFSGWATKNDLRCSDGRTIKKDAFIGDNGKTVPLVWNHQHNNPESVVGHALLENREDGVYAYCTLNDTPKGKIARELIRNKDIRNLSIYANNLKQESGNVLHGVIREVSMVLSGANPGALIDYPIVQHSDGNYDEDFTEAVIHTGEEIDMRVGYYETEEEIEHADKEEGMANQAANEGGSDKTIKEVFDTFNEEQKQVVYFMIGEALKGEEDKEETAEHSDYDNGGYLEMAHNVFDRETIENNTLSHSEIQTIFDDAKRGTLSESVLAHAEEYGIDGIEWLFPEDHELNKTPEFVKRDQDWVSVVMQGIHHTPFSRIKTTFADITEDEARAKGYIKGTMKKEEVFTLLRRRTDPQTIYKKQKFDRDDIIDITDFDVVSWVKGEMRMMLNEEIARAIVVGDGRTTSDPDKIQETHVRPVANDADFFTIKKAVVTANGADDETKAKAFIKTVIKAFKTYKGAARPTMFTTTDKLTDMLLIEDNTGRTIYDTEAALANKLRVGKIVETEILDNATIGDKKLLAVIVDLNAYNVGADKGGEVNMFDDFDIDYNQQKYLIETRISGALVKPYSAIAIFEDEVPESVDGGITYSRTVTENEEEDDGQE